MNAERDGRISPDADGSLRTALVAGGAGFLGSHVCEALLLRGFEVVCLDNFVTGQQRNVDRFKGNPRFSLLRSDVCLAPEWGVDLVLHLASPASPIHYKQFALETMLANSSGTLRLLDIARKSDARFVFASTSEVYGDPLVHPQPETYWGNVNPIGPRACYDEAKRFGEALTLEHRRRHGTNASIVRIFNTYGPCMNADDGRVVPAFITAALAGAPIPVHGDGSQTRSFCYVSDLVDGLLHVALDDTAAGAVLNVGNPHEITVRELARLVCRAAGSDERYTFLPRGADDPERRRADIGRMRSRYGWEPQVDLCEGLDRTVAFFRAEQEAQQALVGGNG